MFLEIGGFLITPADRQTELYSLKPITSKMTGKTKLQISEKTRVHLFVQYNQLANFLGQTGAGEHEDSSPSSFDEKGLPKDVHKHLLR